MADKNKKFGFFPYVVACLSFIPLVGVLFGILSIIYGAVKRSIALALIGFAGISFSVAIYGYLFMQLRNPTGVNFQNFSKLYSEVILPRLIKDIEYYKLQNGKYPESLKEVNSDNVAKNSQVLKTLGEIFYRLEDNGKSYHLFMTGPDGIPFTNDDILPIIKPEELKKIGLKSR